MSHVITVALTSNQNLVVDLRPCDVNGNPQGASLYRACRLKLQLMPNGANKTVVLCQPVSLADGAATPAAATVPALPSSGSTNVIGLDSTANPLVEVGQQYSKGFSDDNFRERIATHLLLTCGSQAVNQMQIVVD